MGHSPLPKWPVSFLPCLRSSVLGVNVQLQQHQITGNRNRNKRVFLRVGEMLFTLHLERLEEEENSEQSKTEETQEGKALRRF